MMTRSKKRQTSCLNDNRKNANRSNSVEKSLKRRRTDLVESSKKIDLLNNDIIEKHEIEYVKRPTELQVEKPGQEGPKTQEFQKIKIKCETCDVILEDIEVLKQHKPVDSEKLCCFACNSCSKQFSHPGDFLKHAVEHNLPSKSRPRHITVHQQQIIAENPIGHKISCDMKYIPQKNKKVVENKNEDGMPLLQNIVAKCCSCDVVFTDAEILLKHSPVGIQTTCSFKCKVCPKTFTKPLQHLNHLYEHFVSIYIPNCNRRNKNSKRTVKRYKCSMCEETFLQQFLVTLHEEEHKKEMLLTVKAEKEEILIVDDPFNSAVDVDPNETEDGVAKKPDSVQTHLTPQNNEVGEIKPKIWVIKEARCPHWW